MGQFLGLFDPKDTEILENAIPSLCFRYVLCAVSGGFLPIAASQLMDNQFISTEEGKKDLHFFFEFLKHQKIRVKKFVVKVTEFQAEAMLDIVKNNKAASGEVL